MQKFAKRITKKVSNRLKRSRKPIPAVQDIDLQSSPNQNIEDTLHLNPPTDGMHPTTTGGPGGCVNQGPSGELTSKVLITPPGVEETSGLKSVIAELRDAVQCVGETMDLSDIAYAKDAGLDTRKRCLPGTRTDILSQITEWINSSDDVAQRVLWLSGPAGKGKSAIAHTIAKRFKDRGRLGSCFCFDRAQVKRHEHVFSTIARDLADCDPEIRRGLADAVKNNTALKNSSDIFQQWEKLVMDPLEKVSASSVGPVLIVIEALDESGEEKTRRDLLRILADKLQDKKLPSITKLPSNFRILITSRPLRDIEKEFEGADNIRRLSMDGIPEVVAECDIYAFVLKELKVLPEFRDIDLAPLAAKADGLFEWARLACGHIKDTPTGVPKMPRFNALVNPSAGKKKNPLYDIYQVILKDILKRDQYDDDEYEEALAGFRSVMRQILGTAEPLPFDSLKAMRRHFPDRSKHGFLG